MGRAGVSRFASMLLLLVAAGLFFQAGPVFAQNDRAAKEAELKRLRDKITSLRRDLDKVRNRYDSLRAELGEIETRIGQLTRNLAEIDILLQQQRKKITELRTRQQNLQQTITEQRRYLAGQVRAAYMMGRQEYFKILLNQEDPATVGRMITYYDYLNRARTEQIAKINAALQELESVRASMVEESERLNQLRARQAEEMQQLQASSEDREVVLAKLKGEISSKDKELERMLRDEKQLEELIKAVIEALADIPPEAGKHKPFGSLKGKLKWPVRGPLLAEFGTERNTAELRWQGVMIKAREGQEVKAISNGRVAFADWLRGYGLLIIIDHGDGYMSLYGHNQSLYKEAGDWVEGGDLIASVGSSGGNERTALYFEIRHEGKPDNPKRWCR